MIRMDEWVNIVAAHHRGVPIKEISRKTGISRNAVRRAIRREDYPKYERPAVPSKLDPYKDFIKERLAEFPNLTVEKLYRELKAQGYDGGKTILADYTRPMRIARKNGAAIRFETPPGKQAQCDWFELGYHDIGPMRIKLYIFSLLLGYSRMQYSEIVTDMTSQTFLACHEHAFAFFGGITEEILYDNAKVIALQHNREGVVFNQALLDFAGRYGFEPKVCRPYRPQTKGKVERSGGYVKDSFLTGETFAGLDDMQTRLIAWLDNVANVRIHGTTKQRPCDMFMDENLLVPRLPDSRARIVISLVPRPTRRFIIADTPAVEERPLTAYEAILC